MSNADNKNEIQMLFGKGYGSCLEQRCGNALGIT